MCSACNIMIISSTIGPASHFAFILFCLVLFHLLKYLSINYLPINLCHFAYKTKSYFGGIYWYLTLPTNDGVCYRAWSPISSLNCTRYPHFRAREPENRVPHRKYAKVSTPYPGPALLILSVICAGDEWGTCYIEQYYSAASRLSTSKMLDFVIFAFTAVVGLVLLLAFCWVGEKTVSTKVIVWSRNLIYVATRIGSHITCRAVP